jgi:prepilin-type N-terminal cleavage/methylation domain-containing protein
VNQRAFTLLEMLIAIALMVGVGAAVFAFADSLLVRRERFLASSDTNRVADVLLEELERVLPATFVTDFSGRAGIKGDASHIHVRARGVRLGSRPSLSDQVAVEVHFDESTGVLSGMRDAEMAPIGRVGRVRFRYWDGRLWSDSYDSASAGHLPLMVEVRIWLDPVADHDETTQPDRTRVISIPDARGGA